MIPEKNEIVVTIEVQPGTTPLINRPRIVMLAEKTKAKTEVIVPRRHAIRSNSMEYENVILRTNSRILNGLYVDLPAILSSCRTSTFDIDAAAKSNSPVI